MCLLQLFVFQVVTFLDFEINLIFLIKPFFYTTKNSRQEYLETKNSRQEYLENKKGF